MNKKHTSSTHGSHRDDCFLNLVIAHFGSYRNPRARVHRCLRQFAIWCAENTPGIFHHQAPVLLAVVRDFLAGKISDEERDEVRNQYMSQAIAAGVVGLRHGCTNAPSFLAAHACLLSDGQAAALKAVHMAQLGAEMQVRRNGEHPGEARRRWREQAKQQLLLLTNGLSGMN